MRNYYSRPTLHDLQFEERGNYGPQNIYSGDQLYDWNIHGRLEFEISKFLQEICIPASAYAVNNFTNDQIAFDIVSSFSGQLIKSWWDNTFTPDERIHICNHTISEGQKTNFLFCSKPYLSILLVEQMNA